MRASVFIGITEGKLITDRAFLQEAESMAQADVIVCLGRQAWANKIRAEHSEKICGGPRLGFGWRWVAGRRCLSKRQAQTKQQRNNQRGLRRNSKLHAPLLSASVVKLETVS